MAVIIKNKSEASFVIHFDGRAPLDVPGAKPIEGREEFGVVPGTAVVDEAHLEAAGKNPVIRSFFEDGPLSVAAPAEAPVDAGSEPVTESDGAPKKSKK